MKIDVLSQRDLKSVIGVEKDIPQRGVREPHAASTVKAHTPHHTRGVQHTNRRRSSRKKL